MRMWRTHPVRFAALLGAVAGVAQTLFDEVGGLSNHSSNSVLSMLLPGSMAGPSVDERTILQTVFILFVEFVANVLVYALLFSLVAGLAVAVRRVFTRGSSRRAQE